MKIQLCQINPCVGDLRGNLDLMKAEIMEGFKNECDVLLFPELVTTGYPPRDFLCQSWIWDEHNIIASELLMMLRGLKRQMTIIYGGLHQIHQSYGKKERYNAAYVVDPYFGIRFVHKRLLPEYDVFYESRYFTSAINEPCLPVPIAIQSRKKIYTVSCDILICEDIWNNKFQGDTKLMPAAYTCDPIEQLRGDGPLFVLNGSPFWEGKIKVTKKLVEDICARIRRPVCWVNQVGAHDDIITGGYSMVSIPNEGLPPTTKIAKAFETDRMIVRLADQETKHDYLNGFNSPPKFYGKPVEDIDFEDWCVYQACTLFVRDYMRRCGFEKAVLGLSGGIDSALVAVIAAEAIGAANVIGISLPSQYSSDHSKSDAAQLAEKLGIDYRTISINDLHEGVRSKFLSGGNPSFNSSLTDENIQPRLRALLLMVVSNDEKALLLTTGNKSEISVGYCTIYGDLCGGIAPLADLWKTRVFQLAKFINKYRDGVIPENIITKVPSAELKPDQKDTDNLPPYEELDPVLKMITEDELTISEIGSKLGIVPSWLLKVYQLYMRSEYKRKQMPAGAKLSQRSFGSGRSMPIACKETHCR